MRLEQGREGPGFLAYDNLRVGNRDSKQVGHRAISSRPRAFAEILFGDPFSRGAPGRFYVAQMFLVST